MTCWTGFCVMMTGAGVAVGGVFAAGLRTGVSGGGLVCDGGGDCIVGVGVGVTTAVAIGVVGVGVVGVVGVGVELAGCGVGGRYEGVVSPAA